MQRKYFEINESMAKQANGMMSFSEYKAGSLTAEYKALVDKAYDMADQVAEKQPDEAERVYKIAESYSKRMANNLNERSRIGCMCPSVMIAGPANFPVRKKEKQNAACDKNMHEREEIQKMLDKILRIARGTEVILSGDNKAVEKLEKKLEGLKEGREKMKAINAYYSKHKTLDGCQDLSDEEIEKLKKEMRQNWHIENKPFLSYQLRNNNAEIHRVEKRLKVLKTAKDNGNKEQENEHFKIVENTEIMRLQLFFDNKPDEDMRTLLKRNGFRWSPRNKCWQRQLTENARYALRRVIKKLEECE